MKCSHQWHLQLAEQRQDVTTGNSSENPVLVLHTDQIISVEVQKLGGPLVRSLVLLGKLQSYTLRIVVRRVRIVDWNGEQPRSTVFGSYGSAEVSGERGNATLPR